MRRLSILLLVLACAAYGAQAPRWEAITLGNGVEALMLYGTDEVTGMMLVDAGLLSLAVPESRPAVDAFMERMKGGRPLYFVVTATREAAWEAKLVFSQGGRSFAAAYPEALGVLEGEAGTAGPSAPASGVILLPRWFNLREPVRVSWSGAEATFRFKR